MPRSPDGDNNDNEGLRWIQSNWNRAEKEKIRGSGKSESGDQISVNWRARLDNMR